MNYYLDTEFDGWKGRFISMALVREDGHSLYAIEAPTVPVSEWVAVNVLTVLYDVPVCVRQQLVDARGECLGRAIQSFLSGDDDAVIHSDWPDDIKYFCDAVVTGPGVMIATAALSFEVHRIDAYPTKLAGAVQHNAWWDAMALRYALTGESNDYDTIRTKPYARPSPKVRIWQD